MSFKLVAFTKEQLDKYLGELAKEFRRLGGAAIQAELILIGGAAILANYGFREMTTDIDAVILSASIMKDAINHVGDRFNLPNAWLNADFMRTDSYSPKLAEVSVYYKTFSRVLEVHTISAEFLIAMKLKAGRKFKNDLSDVIGILAEHEKRGEPITYSAIDLAVRKLYGTWESVSTDAQEFITAALREGNYAKVYNLVCEDEKKSKESLIHFEKQYPKLANTSNVNEILRTLKDRKNKELQSEENNKVQ